MKTWFLGLFTRLWCSVVDCVDVQVSALTIFSVVLAVVCLALLCVALARKARRR